MKTRRIVAQLLAVALIATTRERLAVAQPTPEDRALAETLFQQARQLMDEKRHLEACPKLEESQRIAPAGGTLLNLAACHEAVGRIAAAWAAYRDAEAQAIKSGRADRQKIARARIEVLAPQVPKLVVVVSAELAALGPRVTRDGTELGAAAWGIEIPLDPGPHVVRVTAAGRVPWESKLDLQPSKVERVVVPSLAPVTAAPVVEPAVVPLAPPASATVEPRQAPPKVPATQRLVGWSLVAGGALWVGVGGYFGVRAVAKRSESDAECMGRLCTPEGFSRNEDARSAARSSNLFLGVGLLLAGGGLVVALTAPSQATAVSVGVGAGTGNVRVRW